MKMGTGGHDFSHAVRSEEREELRARAEITSHFAAGPQARWRGASDELYPGRYVRSEQQSQRACGPQPAGARRRAGICGVAAPRRCHHIACVAAPCICPPGARAKMHTLFSDGPLAPSPLPGRTPDKCFLTTSGEAFAGKLDMNFFLSAFQF